MPRAMVNDRGGRPGGSRVRTRVAMPRAMVNDRGRIESAVLRVGDVASARPPPRPAAARRPGGPVRPATRLDDRSPPRYPRGIHHA